MKEMSNKEAICQSCGMPLKQPSDCGSNADGGKNNEYCHYCFEKGSFTQPSLTKEQMIEKVANVGAQKFKMPLEKAKSWAQGIIPMLKRWKK